jgi:GNAT superfamily N-acetyltransferase
MASGALVFLIADDPPAGIAVVSFRRSVWTTGPTALLEDLFVLAEARRRGLGRALLRAAMELARARDASLFELFTGEGDTAARTLYEAHGLRNIEPGETELLLYYHRSLDHRERDTSS